MLATLLLSLFLISSVLTDDLEDCKNAVSFHCGLTPTTCAQIKLYLICAQEPICGATCPDAGKQAYLTQLTNSMRSSSCSPSTPSCTPSANSLIWTVAICVLLLAIVVMLAVAYCYNLVGVYRTTTIKMSSRSKTLTEEHKSSTGDRSLKPRSAPMLEL